MVQKAADAASAASKYKSELGLDKKAGVYSSPESDSAGHAVGAALFQLDEMERQANKTLQDWGSSRGQRLAAQDKLEAVSTQRNRYDRAVVTGGGTAPSSYQRNFDSYGCRRVPGLS